MDSLHQHASSFSPASMGTVAFLVLFSGLYFRGWRRVSFQAANHEGIWRAVSFLLGVSLIWIALYSPIASYDHDLLTVHMIQHLLLMTFAPALILLGEPLLAISRGMSEFERIVIAPLLQSMVLKRIGKMIVKPSVCWSVSAITLVAWHVPFLFTAALHSGLLHGFEQFSFFAAGMLFWWPVVEPWPSEPVPHRWPILLYLFFATLPCDILSGFLVFSERVAYPIYFSAPRHFGFSVLADQQCAGALMWTVVTVVYIVPAVIIATRLLSPQSHMSRKRLSF